MNIAYIIPSIIKQGPPLVILDLVKEMQRRGHECCVYYFDEKSGADKIDYPCPTQRIKMSDSLLWDKIDVVHTHSWRAEFYMARHRNELKNTRYISTIHEFIYANLRSKHSAVFSFLFTQFHLSLLRKADCRVCLSLQHERYYKKKFGKLPLTYIYNTKTVDYNSKLTAEEEQEILSFKEETSNLLGLNALLTPRKAVDVVIDALPLLKDCKLFVVGNGMSLDDLKKRAKEKGVADRVYFAGYKTDAFRYIPYYDIYMMPSRSEGFPLALLEAMAFKCNAVISDIPIFKEFFTENEMTFFHLDDPKDCARAVKEAINNKKGDKAYIKYMECYSPRIFGDMYEKVYKGSCNPHID